MTLSPNAIWGIRAMQKKKAPQPRGDTTNSGGKVGGAGSKGKSEVFLDSASYSHREKGCLTLRISAKIILSTKVGGEGE